MLTRRELLGGSLALAASGGAAPALGGAASSQATVNDIHSKLNRTTVAGILRPGSRDELEAYVRRAAAQGRQLCVAGGRHAMGGQQFARDAWLLDLNAMTGVTGFDRERGIVTARAGTQWPELVEYLLEAQRDASAPWGIVQKQTGADRLSLGGALAANAHGRGLTLAPMVGDVEAFSLVDANGNARRCSRHENEELFRAAIGGYGLFGVITSVELRLARRRRIERVVEVVDLADLMRRLDERIAEGFLYGDCQFETSLTTPGGLRRGVFSCYRPTERASPVVQRKLSADDWRELVLLAHLDPERAFETYAAYYLGTSGQVYWSDTHQMSTYLDDYHDQLSRPLGPLAGGSEMISELYVPRDALVPFMERARRELRARDAKLIYGTIRLIERDHETLLPWARERWACVIFNLHTAHDAAALARTADAFRALIDAALAFDGSYYLTYHRWARADQLLAAHPTFRDFLARKRRFDPEERFVSDWYAHQRRLLAS